MRKVTLFLTLIAIFAGCGQNTQKAEQVTANTNNVNVYYFHGKKRCKTCVAVGDVARQTVEKNFADNNNVCFIDINTSENRNDALIEKFEVTWNALIIAKGEDFVEITEQAFATAVKNPQSLENLIKEEVNKRQQ